MFIGKKIRKVDAKRRILVPSKWKMDKYILVNDNSIKIYPFKQWLEIFNGFDEDDDKEDFSSKSYELKIDSSGRILLPKFVKSCSVVLIGMGNYFLLKESDL
ncbi:MAG TPA: hypothetical protein P5060_01190 [Candidatus Absconditabacterales bacterium]|nr:hypothetical protein [Candidatus Absconditabacterales bacterium]